MAQSDKKVSESPHKRNSVRNQTITSMRESALPRYFREKRKEVVLNSLEAIETDIACGKPVRWNLFIPVIRGMRIKSTTVPDCLKFAKELLGLLERCQCKNVRVISEVFLLLMHLTEPYFISLDAYEIEYEKIFFYPYGKAETDTDLVWSAVSCANLGLLKLQLKFGMGMLPYPSFCSIDIDELLRNWPTNCGDDIKQYESTEDYDVFVTNGLITGFGITKSCGEAIEKNLSRNFNPESVKRLNLVLRMMDVVLAMKLSRPAYKENFIACYRLLFDSIPEAFVTSVEVKASLEKCLPASFSRIMSMIIEDFKNLLPELAEVPQPRSLKHLCRIQVRQSLRQNLNLPSGVSSLTLPTSLKKYIMLNDDGDYSAITESYRLCDFGRQIYSNQELYINIPERDDCVISFLKNL